jgi:hypothetical protein
MPISASIFVRCLALFVAVLGASGCTYKPGYEDSPVARSFAWFSYLNADDIRSQCSGSGPDRYRIVYNGNTDEQVRTYDITADSGGGGDLKVQVTGVADWAAGVPIDDLLSPWRGRIERRQLSADQLQAIRSALRASGFSTPPPDGTILRSWSFYWLAAACEGGRFTFNGWGYPSDRFARATLAGPLMAVDPTGIAFNPPRDDTRPDQDDRRRQRYYQLVITSEGIRDNFTPF